MTIAAATATARVDDASTGADVGGRIFAKI
jgi:hypothetical protein